VIAQPGYVGIDYDVVDIAMAHLPGAVTMLGAGFWF
jgi:hypothetical protein